MNLLTTKRVAEKLDVSKSYVWWLLRNREDFPRPVHLGKNHTAWFEQDLDAWLLTLKQKGDAHEAQ